MGDERGIFTDVEDGVSLRKSIGVRAKRRGTSDLSRRCPDNLCKDIAAGEGRSASFYGSNNVAKESEAYG